MPYVIGIEFGPTEIRAAVCSWSEGRWAAPEVVLLGAREATVAAAVFIAASGEVFFGDPASEHGRGEPDRFVDELARNFGDPNGIWIDGKSWNRDELARRLVGWVIDRVAERQRELPMRVAIAHPVSWGPYQRELLELALSTLQPSAVLLSQPSAAALAVRRAGLVHSAAPITACQMTRDSAQVAVVRSDGELEGTPEELGTEDRLPVDLDQLVDRLAAALRATMTSAGLRLDQAATVIVAGSRSSEPAITSRLSELLHCAIAVGADPENTVLLGAAVYAQPAQTPVSADQGRSTGGGTEAADWGSVVDHLSTGGVDDDTQFTIYRPARVRPQRWYPLLAFVHRTGPFVDPDSGELVEPADLVHSEADRLLTDQTERYHPVTADSELRVPGGSEIVLEPWLSAGEFNPPHAMLRMEEAVHRIEFRFRTTRQAVGRITGGLRVYLADGHLLAGEVRFTTEVSVGNPQPGQVGLERIPVRRYRRIFASYSHLDSGVVTAMAEYVSAMGDQYFIDAVTLRSGERWESRLTELIDQADIFQLFWSRNAMYSEQVQREWEHALGLNRDGFIRPVYWEEPRPTDPSRHLPPPRIGQLHWAKLPIQLSPPRADPPTPNQAPDRPSTAEGSGSTPSSSPQTPVWPDRPGLSPDGPTPSPGLIGKRPWPGPPYNSKTPHTATNASEASVFPETHAETTGVAGEIGTGSAPVGGWQAPTGSRPDQQSDDQAADRHMSDPSAPPFIADTHSADPPDRPAADNELGGPLDAPRDVAPPPSPRRGKSRRGFTLIAGGASVAVLLASFAMAGVVVLGRWSATGGPVVTPVVPASAWRALRPDPTPRQQVATTVADGTVWVLGGITSGAATNVVEGYDPAVDTWKTGIPLPTPLSHEMAVTYRGEIIVLGGWEAQGSNLTAVSSNKVYAQRGGGWVELPPMLSPHVAGGAAVVGDQIIVSGGQADGKLNPTTEMFDGTAWRRVTDLPTPREHLGMATDGTYVYVAGGRNLSSDKNTATLERYDPKTDSWATLAAMPAPRGGIGATVADGRLVVAGGEEPTSVDNSVFAYDIASNTWSDLPPMPTGRHGLAVTGIDKTVFTIDGATSPGQTESTGVAEALQMPPRRLLPASVWRPLKDAPIARQFAGSAVAGGRMWIAGGLTQNAVTAAVVGYDPTVDNWTKGPDLPIPLHHLAAVTYHDEVVVIGGQKAGNGTLYGAASDKVFALRNGAWVELPPLTHPRIAAGAAVVGDKIVVAGGQADNRLVAPTEVFDGTQWTDAAPIPTPREQLSATTDGTYVYAIGGHDLSSDTVSGASERFDPTTGDWLAMPNMLIPRGGVAAACIDGRVVVAGGRTPKQVLSTVQAYDIATGTWSALPSLTAPRYGLALAALGNTIIAVGGAQLPTVAGSVASTEALDFS